MDPEYPRLSRTDEFALFLALLVVAFVGLVVFLFYVLRLLDRLPDPIPGVVRLACGG